MRDKIEGRNQEEGREASGTGARHISGAARIASRAEYTRTYAGRQGE